MERLTERKHDGTGISKKPVVDNNIQKHGITNYGRQIITKLADYEDAEEQGLLLKLSCKVGDRVYTCFKNYYNEIRTVEAKRIELGNFSLGNVRYLVEPIGRRGSLFRYYERDFGKTVFLTREAVEQALNERMEYDGIS